MITILCDHPDCNQTAHESQLMNITMSERGLSFAMPEGWHMQQTGDGLRITCPTHSGETVGV